MYQRICISKQLLVLSILLLLTVLPILYISTSLLQKKQSPRARADINTLQQQVAVVSKGTFRYNGNAIAPYKDVSPNQEKIMIDTIYIQNTFSKEEKDTAIETIRNVWKEEKVKKNIDLSKIDEDPARIVEFDQRTKSNCSYECHLTSTIGYFPEAYCAQDNTNQIAITSFVWFNGCGQVFNDKRRAWIELFVGYDTNYPKNRQVIKHEMGHMLGAPHTFEIAVSGDLLGRFAGFGKDHSRDKDVMNYNGDDDASEYTKYIIDESTGNAQKNMYEDGFHASSVQLVSEDKVDFSKSSFFIYGGTKASSLNKKGSIIEEAACYYPDGDPRRINIHPDSPLEFQNNIPTSDGVISNLDKCFFKFPYVAAFVELTYEGKIYRGSFDLVDLGHAVKRGEKYPKVRLYKEWRLVD